MGAYQHGNGTMGPKADKELFDMRPSVSEERHFFFPHGDS
jgi:hypothetical protein